MSEGRAIVNVIGNSVATIIIAKSEKQLDVKRYKLIVEKKIADIPPKSASSRKEAYIKD
jgi:aerobic C4-dicarboxylate transport protein